MSSIYAALQRGIAWEIGKCAPLFRSNCFSLPNTLKCCMDASLIPHPYSDNHSLSVSFVFCVFWKYKVQIQIQNELAHVLCNLFGTFASYVLCTVYANTFSSLHLSLSQKYYLGVELALLDLQAMSAVFSNGANKSHVHHCFGMSQAVLLAKLQRFFDLPQTSLIKCHWNLILEWVPKWTTTKTEVV